MSERPTNDYVMASMHYFMGEPSLLYAIFGGLSAADLCRASAVCRRWHRLLTRSDVAELLWQYQIMRHWTNERDRANLVFRRRLAPTWKHAFLERVRRDAGRRESTAAHNGTSHYKNDNSHYHRTSSSSSSSNSSSSSSSSSSNNNSNSSASSSLTPYECMSSKRLELIYGPPKNLRPKKSIDTSNWSF
jgi:F-box-like